MLIWWFSFFLNYFFWKQVRFQIVVTSFFFFDQIVCIHQVAHSADGHTLESRLALEHLARLSALLQL